MKLRCGCGVVNVGMQTLEDDEDRSRLTRFASAQVGDYHSHCGHRYIIGFKEQGWKTELWLEDTYDHLFVDHVDLGRLPYYVYRSRSVINRSIVGR
jgi:hypothetical protein